MSQSQDDYLKFVYENLPQEGYVSNKMLAQGLDIAPASVSEMVKRLDEAGLLLYQPYYGVQLTPKGLERAQALVRKHEIWEYFLESKLGYEKEEVHDLAEVLEHWTTPELAERLAKYIDFPEGE